MGIKMPIAKTNGTDLMIINNLHKCYSWLFYFNKSRHIRKSTVLVTRFLNNLILFKDAYPSDDGQSEIKKSEGGRYDPNINHGQESKDQSPH